MLTLLETVLRPASPPSLCCILRGQSRLPGRPHLHLYQAPPNIVFWWIYGPILHQRATIWLRFNDGIPTPPTTSMRRGKGGSPASSSSTALSRGSCGHSSLYLSDPFQLFLLSPCVVTPPQPGTVISRLIRTRRYAMPCHAMYAMSCRAVPCWPRHRASSKRRKTGSILPLYVGPATSA